MPGLPGEVRFDQRDVLRLALEVELLGDELRDVVVVRLESTHAHDELDEA